METNNEIHNYPAEKEILYKSSSYHFEYNLIKEGIYPTKPSYTFACRNCPAYPIPDFYLIETVYGSNKEKIQCKINYKNSEQCFTIFFEKVSKKGFIRKIS